MKFSITQMPVRTWGKKENKNTMEEIFAIVTASNGLAEC